MFDWRTRVGVSRRSSHILMVGQILWTFAVLAAHCVQAHPAAAIAVMVASAAELRGVLYSAVLEDAVHIVIVQHLDLTGHAWSGSRVIQASIQSIQVRRHALITLAQ
jgi:hypothetical protein